MIVINLYAGPGAGKSTTASGVFSLLKLHGVNAEYVPEFAKDLTWEKREKTLSNQYYVWAKQYHRMWRLRDDVTVTITDSPLLLTLFYGETCAPFQQTVLETFNNSFDNMNFVINRVKEYNPKGRNQTEEEAKDIDSKMLYILNKHKIDYDFVQGNYQGVNYITSCILSRMSLDQRYYICDHKREV